MPRWVLDAWHESAASRNTWICPSGCPVRLPENGRAAVVAHLERVEEPARRLGPIVEALVWRNGAGVDENGHRSLRWEESRWRGALRGAQSPPVPPRSHRDPPTRWRDPRGTTLCPLDRATVGCRPCEIGRADAGALKSGVERAARRPSSSCSSRPAGKSTSSIVLSPSFAPPSVGDGLGGRRAARGRAAAARPRAPSPERECHPLAAPRSRAGRWSRPCRAQHGGGAQQHGLRASRSSPASTASRRPGTRGPC